MRWPLRYQLLVPFAAALLTALAVASSLNAWLAARRARLQIEDQLRGVARTLVESSFPLTDAVLRQMSGLSGAEFVLVDQQGARLAASRPLAVAEPGRIAASAKGELDLAETRQIAGERYFQAAWPVARRSGLVRPATLYMLFPQRAWREARFAAVWPSLAVGAAALAAGAMLCVVLAARLSRPITLLERQVRRLAEGRFEPVRVPPRNDELRDLVLSVNSLAAQLDDTRRAIQRSERLVLLGQLGGGLAHRLRNDVAGARMAVQLHERHCRQGDVESLHVALRQLLLAEEHLGRFLAAGSPQPPRRAPCRLEDVVADAVELVAPACRHRKVDLSVVAPQGSLPLLNADRDQLRSALVNLLVNGLEAAGPGGRVRIEMLAGAPRGEMLLRVLDSGPGAPPELVPRLFEPFATGKPEGIGLGLAVARQVAEAHGGRASYCRRDAETCLELAIPAGGIAEQGSARPAGAAC